MMGQRLRPLGEGKNVSESRQKPAYIDAASFSFYFLQLRPFCPNRSQG